MVAEYGGGDRRVVAVTTMIRTRNSKGRDTKTSNSTRRCRHKFNNAKTEKIMRGVDWLWDGSKL
jgi:hypothetical protein